MSGGLNFHPIFVCLPNRTRAGVARGAIVRQLALPENPAQRRMMTAQRRTARPDSLFAFLAYAKCLSIKDNLRHFPEFVDFHHCPLYLFLSCLRELWLRQFCCGSKAYFVHSTLFAIKDISSSKITATLQAFTLTQIALTHRIGSTLALAVELLN
jgi:hypothetical protein